MTYDSITALELNDSPLSVADKQLVEARLAEHHEDPDSSLSLQELKNRLQSKYRSNAEGVR